MEFSLAGRSRPGHGKGKSKKSYATPTGATLGVAFSVPHRSTSTSTLSSESVALPSLQQPVAGPSNLSWEEPARPAAEANPSHRAPIEEPRTPPTSVYCPSSSANTSLSQRQKEKRPAVSGYHRDEGEEDDDEDRGEGRQSPPTELDFLIGQTNSILLAGNESLKAVIEAREQLRRLHALENVLDRGLESQDALLRERLDSADQLEVAFQQLVVAVNDHFGDNASDNSKLLPTSPASSQRKTRPRAPSVALSAPPDLRLSTSTPPSRLDSLAEEDDDGTEGDFFTAVESMAASAAAGPPLQKSTSIAQGMYQAVFAPATTPVKQTPHKASPSSSAAADLLGHIAAASSPPSLANEPPDLTYSPGSTTKASSLDTPPPAVAVSQSRYPKGPASPTIVTSASTSPLFSPRDPFLDPTQTSPSPLWTDSAKTKSKPAHHRRTSSQRSVAQMREAHKGAPDKMHVHGHRDVQKREASASERLRILLSAGPGINSKQ